MSDSDASSDDERPTNLASSGSDSEPEPTRKRAIEDSDDDDEDKAEEEEEEEEEIEEVRKQLPYLESFCKTTRKTSIKLLVSSQDQRKNARSGETE